MEGEMSANHTEKKIGEKTYWSSSKAAEYIGVHRCTILEMAKAKRVTYLRQGGFWFLKDWLDAYINKTTVLGNGR